MSKLKITFVVDILGADREEIAQAHRSLLFPFMPSPGLEIRFGDDPTDPINTFIVKDAIWNATINEGYCYDEDSCIAETLKDGVCTLTVDQLLSEYRREGWSVE